MPSTVKFDYFYTNTVQKQKLSAGKYILECWGAQGAGSNVMPNVGAGVGGKGGYSKGTITLLEDTDVFIYVGGTGTTTNTAYTIAKGGFNGGGSAWCTTTGSDPGSGGGGASDIRINVDSIHSRVIVAGGGGGGGEDEGQGGFGGGIEGGISAEKFGSPGNQRNSGSIGSGGLFGYGAHTNYEGGGAGGGWYGANAVNGQTTEYTSGISSENNGGSGGSGYVYTESTASYYPNCLLNPQYYLTEAETIAGNSQITEPNGQTSTGHSGDGYVRITSLYVPPLKFVPIDNSTFAVEANTHDLIDIVIPETYENRSVRIIAAYGFAGIESISSVFIPKSIVSIHSSAFFYCDHLSNVTFEQGSKLTHIMNESFAITNISSIVIPRTITFIGHHAFFNCPRLTSFCACTFNTIDTSNVFELSTQLNNIFVSIFYPSESFSDLPALRSFQICNLRSNALKCPSTISLINPYQFHLLLSFLLLDT